MRNRKNYTYPRFTNFSKNLALTAGWLFTLCKEKSIFVVSCFFYLIKEVNSEETCQLSNDSKISQIYLSHSGRNAYLFLQHNREPSLSAALNNTCGFVLDNKQADFYNGWAVFVARIINTNIILSGQNIEADLLKCMKNFLENFCSKMDKLEPPTATQTPVIIALVSFIICCLFCVGCPDFIFNLPSSLINCCSHLFESILDCLESAYQKLESCVSNITDCCFYLNRRREEKRIPLEDRDRHNNDEELLNFSTTVLPR